MNQWDTMSIAIIILVLLLNFSTSSTTITFRYYSYTYIVCSWLMQCDIVQVAIPPPSLDHQLFSCKINFSFNTLVHV